MKSYDFGPFRLIWERRQLLRNGRAVPIQAKTLQLLHLLIENQGRPLSKEEIMLELWSDRVVEENNLTQRIYHLRRALSSSPETASAIVTVPGVGYLFTMPVAEVSLPPQTALPDEEPNLPENSAEEIAEPTEEQDAREAGRQRSGKVAILLTVSGAVIVFLIIGFLIFRSRNSVPTSTSLPTISPLTTLEGIEDHPAFSPDGRMVAFSWQGGALNNRDIYVKLVNSGNNVRVTSNSGMDQQPVWSSDGQYIALLRRPEQSGDKFHLITVPAFGGKEHEVARVWGGLDWSPDGSWLAISDNDQRGTATGIYLIRPDGSERKPISRPQPEIDLFDTDPNFSPDGRQVVFVRWVSDVSGDVFVADLSAGNLRQLTFEGRWVHTPRWSPDGQFILFISNRNDNNRRLWKIPATGGAPQLVDNIPADLESIDISPTTGTLAFSQSIEEIGIEVASPDGPGITPCEINSSRPDLSPDISPNGDLITFDSCQSGWYEIWTATKDCSRLFQVTSLRSTYGVSPRWSADGKRIIFNKYNNGQADLASVNPDGTDLRLLTSHPAGDMMPSPSNDGKSIYFSSSRSGVSQVFRMPIDGGEAIQVTVGGGASPIDSFDGKTVYYVRNDNLWSKNLSSGEESPVAELRDVIVGRQWDVTPNAIYYIPEQKDEAPSIHRLDLRSRAITTLKHKPLPKSKHTLTISVSADERTIARSHFTFSIGDISTLDGWDNR